jgi:DNA-binding response OmpR family regulator
MEAIMPIELLAILPCVEDRLGLLEIVRHSKWHLVLAETLHGSRTALNYLGRGVVLCDSELPDGDWKTALNQLMSKAVPRPLIVASRLADDRLWAEVLNLGGSDVLALPFDHDEVIRSIGLAWRGIQDDTTAAGRGWPIPR